MFFMVKWKWIVIFVVMNVLKQFNSQLAMYPPPIFAVQPIQVAVALPIHIEAKRTSTTTTTTTEKAIAFVPVPMAVPMALAPPVFCKPRPDKVLCPPMPIPGPSYGVPVPVPAPQPVVIVPFPPMQPRMPTQRPPKRYYKAKRRPISESCDSISSSSSSDTSSDWSYYKKRNKKKGFGRTGKRKMRALLRGERRRNSKPDDVDFSKNEFVKPVLTYISRDGDVKIERRLSHSDAQHLLDEEGTNEVKSGQRIQIVSRKEPGEKSRRLVISNSDGDGSSGTKQKYFVLRKGASNTVLSEGKKELIFKPPINKKIANLSVSFQVI